MFLKMENGGIGRCFFEIDFEIDVFAMIPGATGHQRFGVDGPHFPSDLGCPLSKVVRAGEFAFLQGQNGLT